MRSPTIPLGDHNPSGHTGAEVLAALRGRATLIVFDDSPEVGGMTIQVVDQGEAAMLALVVAEPYTLRLCLNDPSDGLTPTQVGALIEDDLTEASFLGYAGASLTGAGWTITPGAVPSAEHTPVVFTSTANQVEQTIVGYYVTSLGGALRWFEILTTPETITSVGQTITVVPAMTAQTTG